MEASLEEQKELFVLINKAIVHFRELPQSFMTRGHIKTRIDSLDEYWQTFKTKHFELVKMAAVAGKIKEEFSYFKHEMFYLADNTYNTTKGIMVDELEKLDSSSTKTDWKELAMCNEETFKLIKNVGANIKEQSESLKTRGYLQARIATLDDYWQKFSTTHFEILKSATEKQGHTYFEQDIFIQCEEEYITIKGNLPDMLEKLNHPSSKVDKDADNCSDKQQLINEPLQFSEKKDEWNSFKDVCVGIINDKPTLENVQNIIEQAVHLLNYLKIGNDDTKDSLKKTIKIKCPIRITLLHHCLSTLISKEKIQKATPESIKELLDDTQGRLCVLKETLDISNWDTILIHILSDKLDEISLRKWETEVEKLPKDELPTLQRFTDFLDAHYRWLETRLQPTIESDDSDVTTFDYPTVQYVKVRTTIPDNTANFNKPKPFCYNCGKFGHHGHECQYHE